MSWVGERWGEVRREGKRRGEKRREKTKGGQRNACFNILNLKWFLGIITVL